MPKQIDWKELAIAQPETVVAVEAEKMKTYKTTKCQPMACVICTDPYPHLMRYQLFACKSSACNRAVPYMDCPWRGKLITCLKHNVASLFEHGRHMTAVSSPKRSSMPARQKEYCKSLAEQRFKPKIIQRLLRHQFNLSAEETPDLRVVQNCVNYHARKNLGNNDVSDDIAAFVRDHVFTGYEESSKPFTFTWTLDESGRPYVGDGSDRDPFFVGISTKKLISRLDRPSDSFVLHMDATFKLTQVEYPVFVIGISDRVGNFHLVAVFVVSRRLTNFYAVALASLRRMYTAVTGKSLLVSLVMGDAENAQYNAFSLVFGCDSSYTYLMCFFHVLQNVHKKIHTECAGNILRDIYDMHFSSTEDEFCYHRDKALIDWKADPRTRTFANYFEGQWPKGHTNWQIYHTPAAYATTNNPVEQFNKVIKRDYTLNSRTKLGLLLRLLCDCCSDESANLRPFQTTMKPTEKLVKRANQMMRDGLLFEVDHFTSAPSYLVELQRGSTVTVLSAPPPRVYVESRDRSEEYLAITAQMGSNYARMEVLQQPADGWEVDTALRWCPCKYHQKFGSCVHLLCALHQRQFVGPNGKRMMANRRITREKHAVGRPPHAGPALSYQ